MICCSGADRIRDLNHRDEKMSKARAVCSQTKEMQSWIIGHINELMLKFFQIADCLFKHGFSAVHARVNTMVVQQAYFKI